MKAVPRATLYTVFRAYLFISVGAKELQRIRVMKSGNDCIRDKESRGIDDGAPGSVEN